MAWKKKKFSFSFILYMCLYENEYALHIFYFYRVYYFSFVGNCASEEWVNQSQVIFMIIHIIQTINLIATSKIHSQIMWMWTIHLIFILYERKKQMKKSHIIGDQQINCFIIIISCCYCRCCCRCYFCNNLRNEGRNENDFNKYAWSAFYLFI